MPPPPANPVVLRVIVEAVTKTLPLDRSVHALTVTRNDRRRHADVGGSRPLPASMPTVAFFVIVDSTKSTRLTAPPTFGCTVAPKVPPESVESRITASALEPVKRRPSVLPSKLRIVDRPLTRAEVPPVVPKVAPVAFPRNVESWICTVPVAAASTLSPTVGKPVTTTWSRYSASPDWKSIPVAPPTALIVSPRSVTLPTRH